MKKDFETDRLGMYGDPDGNFVIKGNQFNTPITTKYLQQSTLVTTPDGTTEFVPPGQERTFNNPYVAEMKLQAGAQVDSQQQQLMQLISMYCQVVSNGDESCAQKVAQSLQKNPQQMIQQMTATIQQAEQEQGMQEEDAEEDMMKDGGCLDCQEQFPQAQNLNWFYKAEGGEAFPQANMYPLSWADYSGMQYAMGGMTEAFPQAQTYLPYDRPGETRLNGMFQKGGTLYDYVKSMGLDPSFESRKKLFSQYFDKPYKGTVEQNMYLLNALKSGKIGLAERPKLSVPGLAASRSEAPVQKSKQIIKQEPVKGYVGTTPAPGSKRSIPQVEIPGIISAKRDSPGYTSPLIGKTPTPISTKRSVLPKAEKAQQEADKRAIPQTGVIVDKRTGEAVVLGQYGSATFPVLTGKNVEGTLNPYSADNQDPQYMATPTGYYMMSNKNARGEPLVRELNDQGVGLWMNPISAYGVQAPIANYVAIHGTYNPQVRNPLYTAPPEQRNVSKGCVNCRPTDYQHMMGTLGGPDTVMVVDSKKPQDMRLFNEAKKQAESRKDIRSLYTVDAMQQRNPYMGPILEYGGQTLDQIYDIMKRGGLNYNPKKKKGGQESFEQYMMRMGGLAKYQAENSQVGPPSELESFGQQDVVYSDYDDDSLPPDNSRINVPRNPQDFDYNYEGVSGGFIDPSLNNRALRSAMRYQRRGVRQERRRLNKLLDAGSKYEPSQSPVSSPSSAAGAATQSSAQSSNQQQSGFGPGSQYDLTVRQRQAADPYAAYTGGRNLTNMFGSGFGAGMSILNALGATGSSLSGGKSRFKTKTYGPGRDLLGKTKVSGSAADIAAQGFFGNMFPQQQQTQQPATPASPTPAVYPQTGPNPNYIPYRMDQEDNPANFGPKPPLKFFQPGGTQFEYTFSDPTQMNVAPSAFSAGVADQFNANRLDEIRKQMYNRSAMTTAPITTATKTQMGSPQGAINAPSFVPYTTEASRPTDAYMPQRLMFGQMGGMMDELQDGEEIDLSDMTPDERDQFIQAIYAAGGSVEFI